MASKIKRVRTCRRSQAGNIRANMILKIYSDVVFQYKWNVTCLIWIVFFLLRWILCFPKRRCFYLGNLFSWTISSKTSAALCLSSKISWRRYGAEDGDDCDKDHTSCQRREGFVCRMLIFVYRVITFKIIVELMTLFQLWQAVKLSFIRPVEYLLLWDQTD